MRSYRLKTLLRKTLWCRQCSTPIGRIHRTYRTIADMVSAPSNLFIASQHNLQAVLVCFTSDNNWQPTALLSQLFNFTPLFGYYTRRIQAEAYIWPWSCRRRWCRWTAEEVFLPSLAAWRSLSLSPCRTVVVRKWIIPTVWCLFIHSFIHSFMQSVMQQFT